MGEDQLGEDAGRIVQQGLPLAYDDIEKGGLLDKGAVQIDCIIVQV